MTTLSLPRTAIAVLLTTVWPGSGHLVVRRWWDGASWTLLSIAIIVFGWLATDIRTVGDVLNPDVLKKLLVINGLLAIARIVALVDLVWTSHAHRTWTGVAISLAALLFIMGPHAFAHRIGTETIALLERVFVTEPARPPTAVLSAAEENDTALAAPDPRSSDEIERELTQPTIQFADDRSGLHLGSDGRFTVLLLGTDRGYGRTGERTDSIMVVSVDPQTLQVAMFGIPRNWGGLEMRPDWPGPDVHPDMANTIYQYGWTNADHFSYAEDPGAVAAMTVFGDLLDLEIDNFVKVSMEGFVELIDAMGGLEMEVTFRVNNEFSLPSEPGYTQVTLEPGIQTLSGLEAMAYSRSRKTSNDYHRMGRQRCVIAAIADQLSPASVLLRYHEIARTIGDHVSTDIPLSQVPSLINLASTVDRRSISTVTFVPPLFVDGGDGLGHKKPHVERVRAAVAGALNGESDDVTTVTDVPTACSN